MLNWIRAALLVTPGAVLAAAGDLDSTFATAGVLNLDFVPQHITLTDSNSDTDGRQKTLVAGQCGANICIDRVLPDGTPDTTFASNGKLVLTLPGATDAQLVSVLDADPGVWIVANTSTAIVIAKLKDDGILDTAFDTDGVAFPAFSGVRTQARQAAVGYDFKLLVGGDTWLTDTDYSRGFIAKLTTSGVPDPVFYGSGRRLFDVGGVATAFDSMAIDAGQRILFSAHSLNDSGNALQVSRISSSGATDHSFSIITRTFEGMNVLGSHVTPTLGSEFLISAALGNAENALENALLLRKLDGSAQTDFDVDGEQIGTWAGRAWMRWAIQALPDGDFVLAAGDDGQDMLLRVAADGVLTDINSARDHLLSEVLVVKRGGQWSVASQSPLMQQLTGDDRSPASFDFPRQDGVGVSTLVNSAPKQLTGLMATADVHAKNGVVAVSNTLVDCSTLTYLSSAQINNNQYLCVQQTAATEPLAEKISLITVGDQRTAFITKTKQLTKGGGGGGGGLPLVASLLTAAGLLLRRLKIQA